MFSETLEKLDEYGIKKVKLLNQSKTKYFIASVLAGFYVGLGIFLIMTIGGVTSRNGYQYKIFMGLGFGIALSLVIMAGSELFTGNNMAMFSGMLNKKIAVKDGINIWTFSYIGNLAGSMLVGLLFFLSNAANKDVTAFLLNTAKSKMNTPAPDLFFKGVLCNILVCLAVWCGTKMKTESGKLIMIFWCILIFMTCGFEHSIADMSIIGIGVANGGITVGQYLYTVLLATVGNIIGGAVFVAVPYHVISKEK